MVTIKKRLILPLLSEFSELVKNKSQAGRMALITRINELNASDRRICPTCGSDISSAIEQVEKIVNGN